MLFIYGKHYCEQIFTLKGEGSMKKLFAVFLLGFLCWAPTGISSATLIDGTSSYTLDWDKHMGPESVTSEIIHNSSYSFSFGELVIPEGAVIDSVELILTYQGNKDRERAEVWKLDFNGVLYDLKDSRDWTEQSFSLDPNFFSEGPVSIAFNLTEYTIGPDRIDLDKAVLNIHYSSLGSEGGGTISFDGEAGSGNAPSPNPEPATMLLLGTGLLGLAGLRRKFKK